MVALAFLRGFPRARTVSHLPAAAPAAILAEALLVAGCSGGTAGSPSSAPPPISGTSVLAAGSGSIAAPAVDGVSARFATGPGATPGTGITVASFATAPANGVVPSSVRRTTALAGAQAFYYVTLTFTQSTHVTVTPTR